MVTRTYKVFAIINFAFLCVFIATEVCKAGQGVEIAIPKQAQTRIEAGSKFYIAPMDGFETYLKAAILTEKVPIQIVDQREDADYEITSVPDTKKAGAAKTIIKDTTHSASDLSIEVSSVKYHDVVYARSVHEKNSSHGEQSNAEGWAKHFKDEGVAAR